MILLGLVCTTKVTLGERCWLRPLVVTGFLHLSINYLFEGQTILHQNVYFASVTSFTWRGFARRMMSIHVAIFSFLQFISIPECCNMDLAFKLGC